MVTSNLTQGDTIMRKLFTSAIIVSAVIAAFSASAAVEVSGQSHRSDVRTISDLHQPVRIGVASQVLRRMP